MSPIDQWKKAIDENKCLIYSFGIANDWTFEEILADMGCTVRTFDPTINGIPLNIKNKQITFEKVGLSHFSGHTQVKILEISIKVERSQKPFRNLMAR